MKTDVSAVFNRIAKWPSVWKRAVHSIFTLRVFCECLLICNVVSFPFGFEDGIWDLIVLIPYLLIAAFLCTLLIIWTGSFLVLGVSGI